MADKFTPGEWTFKYSSGAGFGIWVDASKALGERYSKDCPVWHVNPDPPSVQIAYELWTQFPRNEWEAMQQANGKLMAAAPDLLAALRLAYRHLNGGWDSLTPKEHAEAFDLARAAILKATGEPS